MKVSHFLTAVGLVSSLVACDAAPTLPQQAKSAISALVGTPAAPSVHRNWRDERLNFGLRLSAAAEERATHSVTYDASYQQIAYPMGDVAADRGVCADEIVRAYRLLGIDLQERVHKDMKRAFHVYPKKWGLKAPDTNIDHRRVPNLATYFEREGAARRGRARSDDAPAAAAGDFGGP